MTPVYSRTNPFPGKMVVNRRLNEGNRNKEHGTTKFRSPVPG